MSVKFIHCSDFQIAKPYEWVHDTEKRFQLQNARLDVFNEIQTAVDKEVVDFVLIAGDLFDSPTPTNTTVSNTCSAIGKLKVPVYVIPGNHDFGGPGSLWEAQYFLQEQKALAPNLHIILEQEKPIELEHAILFPCPLLRRHEPTDLTTWLRNFDHMANKKARIILAHGSDQTFGSQMPENEDSTSNYLDFNRLNMEEFDYVALGDWHGYNKRSDKIYYSGAPEIDRFPKGSTYDSGNFLIVEAKRSILPIVTKVKSSKVLWHDFSYQFIDESSFDLFTNELSIIHQNRTSKDLIKIEISGSIGLNQFDALLSLIETLEARLIAVRLANKVKVAPTKDEIESLKNRPDPTIALVANELLEMLSVESEEQEIVQLALRELYLQVNK
jgi:DNA repair exonuclease SbcCD nuclease subunit